jgi:hypothetical protein
VGYLISGPLFCLGFLWIAFDGRKQGWHDKIAATLVIRRRGDSDPADTEGAPTAFTAAGIPLSAGVENGFIPLPEQQPEKSSTDGILPGP